MQIYTLSLSSTAGYKHSFVGTARKSRLRVAYLFTTVLNSLYSFRAAREADIIEAVHTHSPPIITHHCCRLGRPRPSTKPRSHPALRSLRKDICITAWISPPEVRPACHSCRPLNRARMHLFPALYRGHSCLTASIMQVRLVI